MAARLILKLVLVWGKQMFTSACSFLRLSTTEVYYIHRGGWVLQVQLANLEVFLS